MVSIASDPIARAPQHHTVQIKWWRKHQRLHNLTSRCDHFLAPFFSLIQTNYNHQLTKNGVHFVSSICPLFVHSPLRISSIHLIVCASFFPFVSLTLQVLPPHFSLPSPSLSLLRLPFFPALLHIVRLREITSLRVILLCDSKFLSPFFWLPCIGVLAFILTERKWWIHSSAVVRLIVESIQLSARVCKKREESPLPTKLNGSLMTDFKAVKYETEMWI
jgi:hypothetical protein